MYDKDGKIVDRREMLRVKLKSLAEEARIIRKEEKRAWRGGLREELYRHRIDVVRRVARNTHIAYGLIKGRTLEQIEGAKEYGKHKHLDPNWQEIGRMIVSYGSKEQRAALTSKAKEVLTSASFFEEALAKAA